MDIHTHDELYEHTHDGTTHTHKHPHDPNHPHVHSDEYKKKMLNRLSRAIGHLQKVRKMVEDDYDCNEVLMQLTAVRSALAGASREIANEHISHCLTEAIEHGSYQELEDFKLALSKLLS